MIWYWSWDCDGCGALLLQEKSPLHCHRQQQLLRQHSGYHQCCFYCHVRGAWLQVTLWCVRLQVRLLQLPLLLLPLMFEVLVLLLLHAQLMALAALPVH
jgi:hypothetical protein